MAEAIDIRELNEKIERHSAFVTNLMTGMDQAIIGQKHLVGIINTMNYLNNFKKIMMKYKLGQE